MSTGTELHTWPARDAQEPNAARGAWFWASSALLFVASVAITIVWCGSMTAMGMPMPGGWTMSMSWMRMAGQTWPGAAASFLGMWVVMMIAMMLPSVVPMLWRYRQAVARTGRSRLASLTVSAGLGYFFVWALFGVIVYPLGVALAVLEMQRPALARAVPVAVGVVVFAAGCVQLTPWKAHHLRCCRESPACGALSVASASPWGYGLRIGGQCCACCAGLMAILLVTGSMDLRAMALVAAAVTLERLAPAGERVAQGIGLVAVGVGLFQIARAAGLG